MIFWESFCRLQVTLYLVSFKDLFEGCNNEPRDLKKTKGLNKFVCTSYAKSYLIPSFFGEKVRQLNFLKLDCRVASRLCLGVFLIRIVSKSTNEVQKGLDGGNVVAIISCLHVSAWRSTASRLLHSNYCHGSSVEHGCHTKLTEIATAICQRLPASIHFNFAAWLVTAPQQSSAAKRRRR